MRYWSQLDKTIEDFKNRFEPVFRYKIIIDKDLPKHEKFDIIDQHLCKAVNTAESALEYLFMDSIKDGVFALHEMRADEIAFVIFVDKAYYDKHIGNLIKEQSDAEFNKMSGRIYSEMSLFYDIRYDI